MYHGLSTAETFSKTDPRPYQLEWQWQNHLGQLEPTGKDQQMAFGRFLRDRYRRFLPKAYSSRDIYVRSADTDRTIASAYAVLATLYEPLEKYGDLNWQPIPVHTVPASDDYLLSDKLPHCDAYYRELYGIASEIPRKLHKVILDAAREIERIDVTTVENYRTYLDDFLQAVIIRDNVKTKKAWGIP